MKIRNVAIIAHVDHGKTTLVDQLLKYSGTFRDNEEVDTCVMDSNPIERERGITILAKTTAIHYQDYLINILDTPGHADFGGEVERIMHMVDGCLLLVDAIEGTMPQTRFVLKKALEAHVKPIVIINKVDRPHADVQKAVDEVLALFMELEAPDDFLDFKVVYTSALNGTSSLSPDPTTQKEGMDPVFDLIVKEIPEPNVKIDGPFQFQPALLDYNDFVGRIGVGVIKRGHVKVGDTVSDARLDGKITNFKVMKLYGNIGLKRVEINEAEAGDIVAIAGLPDINVGETICDPTCIEKEPPLRVDEPTLQMSFGTNTSPLVGLDGKLVTARLIGERLEREVQRDVSLRVRRVPNSESWIVSGRGELHLGILIESMRREGFELQVSKPSVIVRVVDGVKEEPYEDVLIDVPNEYQGGIMETLGNRGGELIDLTSNGETSRLTYVVASRGLLGFVSNFLSLTHGYGIISHTYREYRPMDPNASLGERTIGVLVATDRGVATPYAIERIEDHGVMFIRPGEDCYEGMIVGEHRYNDDMTVNVVMEKHMTNVRSSTKEQTVVLKTPRNMPLEACLDYINYDELVEITPHAYRMRKKILSTAERKKYESRVMRGKVDI